MGQVPLLSSPRGHLARTDAYTSRYDEIIKDIPNKVKCVDDTLLYDQEIESAFYHTWNYLKLCSEKSLKFNKEKFQCCKDTAEFAGLKINSSGTAPSDRKLRPEKNMYVCGYPSIPAEKY